MREIERADVFSRARVLPALHISTRVTAISGKPGVSATSHAVRFTASVLEWLGYTDVKATKVSMELRRQGKVSNAQAK